MADGYNTTELSRRLGISAAAASHHATVLREAKLITTRREGKAVLHVLTPLGIALLEATGHIGQVGSALRRGRVRAADNSRARCGDGT
ncbi:hypothetical protein [Streptomyces collinus]|uniref:hypothetical protein n=1 Tax=Streptomyces collinus TaxID=42684 RepID=UPI003F541DDA